MEQMVVCDHCESGTISVLLATLLLLMEYGFVTTAGTLIIVCFCFHYCVQDVVPQCVSKKCLTT